MTQSLNVADRIEHEIILYHINCSFIRNDVLSRLAQSDNKILLVINLCKEREKPTSLIGIVPL